MCTHITCTRVLLTFRAYRAEIYDFYMPNSSTYMVLGTAYRLPQLLAQIAGCNHFELPSQVANATVETIVQGGRGNEKTNDEGILRMPFTRYCNAHKDCRIVALKPFLFPCACNSPHFLQLSYCTSRSTCLVGISNVLKFEEDWLVETGGWQGGSGGCLETNSSVERR